jgi:hypothetical protein
MNMTVATLEVPPKVFELIRDKLLAAGYTHANGPFLDLSGVALVPSEKADETPWHLGRNSSVAVAEHNFLPITDATPRGVKVQLLTQHHVACYGPYYDLRRTPGIKGWYPVPGIPPEWKSKPPPYIGDTDKGDWLNDRPDLAS